MCRLCHGEADLWGLVALAQEMSQMTPERYRELAGANSKEVDHGHKHGEREGDEGHDHNRSEPSVDVEVQYDH